MQSWPITCFSGAVESGWRRHARNGWGVTREDDGSWYREQDDGRRMRLTRSPSEQARKHVEDLVEKFRGPLHRIYSHMRGRVPLVYGWAIALPRSDVVILTDVDPKDPRCSQKARYLRRHERAIACTSLPKETG